MLYRVLCFLHCILPLPVFTSSQDWYCTHSALYMPTASILPSYISLKLILKATELSEYNTLFM